MPGFFIDSYITLMGLMSKTVKQKYLFKKITL